MLLPEMPCEGFARPPAAPGPDALLADQTVDQFSHRRADLAGFALEPGLVTRIDVVNDDAWAHAGGFGSIDSLLQAILASNCVIREHGN